MSQMLEMDGDTVIGRVSDQFYHLDGSRMWEGALDESQSGSYFEGYFTWNQYLGYRILFSGNHYDVRHLFANGRQIADREWVPGVGIPWPSGCSMSTCGSDLQAPIRESRPGGPSHNAVELAEGLSPYGKKTPN